MEIHDYLTEYAVNSGCSFDDALSLFVFGAFIAIGGFGFCLDMAFDFGDFLYDRCAKPLFKKVVGVFAKKNSAPGKERHS